MIKPDTRPIPFVVSLIQERLENLHEIALELRERPEKEELKAAASRVTDSVRLARGISGTLQDILQDILERL